MKKLFIFLCLLTSSVTMAQKTEGVVTYVRKEYWLKIINRLTFLSQEEKDREAQTWKNYAEDNKGIKMKLAFNPDESLYTYNSDEPEEGGYSWRKSEFYLYRNFEKEKKTDIIEMLGKTYIVDDSLHAPVWKIGNQIKEVAGYICMKAETEDLIKKQKITAWFAQDIPVSAGPERVNGLPGLILELDVNDGDVVIEATNVSFRPLTPNDLKLPKQKGKKITDANYDAVIKQHISERMTSQQNPFGWGGIRY
ncbi:GLPGLI family protein [Spirosoma pollinicola]|uniref:GLPGLI family protein n=1 Tax=Spirosoma pollinicola TaxID=2057025 RepID=A0A2K8YW40_9BACT|nr:GLPGLI family protein [Spirosoma pollinicola]AUD01855.1 GLPGLI family protein [Spirosoma pollinicola]